MHTPLDARIFLRTFNGVARLAHDNAIQHGFWEPGEARNDGQMIALMHSELSEGLENIRKLPMDASDPNAIELNGRLYFRSDHIPEYAGIEEELADVIIRIMDNAVARGWRVPEAVLAKMAFNESRTYKHGKAF